MLTSNSNEVVIKYKKKQQFYVNRDKWKMFLRENNSHTPLD